MDFIEKRHNNAWKPINNMDEFHENYNILIDNTKNQREKKRSTMEAEKPPFHHSLSMDYLVPFQSFTHVDFPAIIIGVGAVRMA